MDVPDSYFWTVVANSLCDLYPDEVMDVVRKAYGDGLVIPGAITLEEFEQTLAMGFEGSLADLRRELARRVPDNMEQLLALCEAVDDASETTPRTIPRIDKKSKVRRKNH